MIDGVIITGEAVKLTVLDSLELEVLAYALEYALERASSELGEEHMVTGSIRELRRRLGA